MRPIHGIGFVLLGSLVSLGSAACHSQGPQGRPEVQCKDACTARASNRCSESECERGCRFILDRLIEHEGSQVVSCIAAGKGACDDQAWAECAVRVGAHADGGPPPPPAPSTDDD
jgi:hypothetical protein